MIDLSTIRNPKECCLDVAQRFAARRKHAFQHCQRAVAPIGHRQFDDLQMLLFALHTVAQNGCLQGVDHLRGGRSSLEFVGDYENAAFHGHKVNKEVCEKQLKSIFLQTL